MAKHILDYDTIVSRLTDEEVQLLFDELNEEADQHTPAARCIYLALYRRLHG